jgi:hypothetical protein
MDSPAFEPMKEGTQVLDQAGGWQVSDVRNHDLPRIPMAKLPYKWLNSMVYGRYNTIVNGC